VLYIGESDLYKNVAPVDASILSSDSRFIVNGTVEDCGVQLGRLFDEATDANLPVSPAAYKPALLINTSGTTGQPKFVVHTPATLSETIDLIIKHWGFSAVSEILRSVATRLASYKVPEGLKIVDDNCQVPREEINLPFVW
jgi:acyl-coenzyme A synthetase/AMP-(fatty) acid ligase